MAKRQPFDTNLSFPPAPTRALQSTPLDGIIGGPPPKPAAADAAVPATPEPPAPAGPAASDGRDDAQAAPSAAAGTYAVADGTIPVTPHAAAAADLAPSSSERPPAPGPAVPADDGKVTVKLPPGLKNRLYNAIYHERATVGDFLTRAVEDLIDAVERERGGPYPQRPSAESKFRAGRRPS